jgi:predicted permease
MTWLSRLFGRRRLERELNQELEFHLEEEIRRLVAVGVDPKEARRRARLELGGVEQVKEEVRDVRGTRWVEDLLGDVKFSLRMMRRTPGFTAAAVLTLAVGIGANTAVYSVVDALLLRRLPLDHPEQLHVAVVVRPDDILSRFSFPAIGRMQGALGDSSAVAAMTPSARMYLSMGDRPEPILGQLISGDWFSLLGVGTATGRPIGPNDNRVLGGHPVAVLSYSYWTRHFGRSPATVGSTIHVNGVPLEVIGVAEAGFTGVVVGDDIEVWIPLMMQDPLRYQSNVSNHNGSDASKPWVDQDQIDWLSPLIRIRPPLSLAEAASRLSSDHRNLLLERHAQADSAARRYRLQERLELRSFARGTSPTRDQLGSPLMALMASVALVLLIACANLASLLLARSAARNHELAVRVSLGARSGRLVRQALTESMTLALVGGLLGLAIARLGSAALLHAAANSPRGIPLAVGLDARVLAFALVVTVATGLLFGIAPALRIGRTSLHQSFKTGGRVVGERHGHRLPLGRLLVASQVALSLVLVTAAGLFVRTLRNLLDKDPGFSRARVLLARLDPRSAGYAPGQLPALNERLLEAARAVPGVRTAAVAMSGLFTGSVESSSYQIAGKTHSPDWDNSAEENFVSPDYLATAGITLLKGRGITAEDRLGSPKVVVVNEAFARHFFEGEDPIGKRIGYDSDKPDLEIVGVIRDTYDNTLREAAPRFVLHPLAQQAVPYPFVLVVRTDGPERATVQALELAIHGVDKNLPVREVVSTGTLVERQLLPEILVSKLAGAFSVVALALAAIGLYGVMSFSVARRRNEMGVRLALGAEPSAVRRLVLRDSLGLIGAGVGLGLVILVPSVGVLRSMVFGLSPRDPTTVLTATVTLMLVGAIAGAVPAWRASRVDPASALRSE